MQLTTIKVIRLRMLHVLFDTLVIVSNLQYQDDYAADVKCSLNRQK